MGDFYPGAKNDAAFVKPILIKMLLGASKWKRAYLCHRSYCLLNNLLGLHTKIGIFVRMAALTTHTISNP
jgi:hypothetical protein